ncbi:MAG: glycosyltransferase family 4 protein [Candidatus Thiodiazotropha sp.]
MVLAICIFSFLLTLVFTRYFIRYASHKNILDFPTDRGSHEEPKPRGGGVVFVLVITTSIISIYFLEDLDTVLSGRQLWPMLVGGLIIALIGYLDDCKGVSQAKRLVVHLLTFTFVLYFYSLPINGDPYIYWPIFFLTVLTAAWMLNLYNFMDGIDGIAASEGIFVLTSAALLIYITAYDEKFMAILLCSSAALLGFLWFNWPPSKLFMGDVGSGFIGYLIGMMIITSWTYGLLQPHVWAILLGFFVFDATATLARRVIAGEPFYKAHKEHIYQRLAQRWKSHRNVTLLVFAINVFWLLPMAWYASQSLLSEYIVLIVSYMPIAMIYIYVEVTQ